MDADPVGAAGLRESVTGDQDGRSRSPSPSRTGPSPGPYKLALDVDCKGQVQRAEADLMVTNQAPVAADDQATTPDTLDRDRGHRQRPRSRRPRHLPHHRGGDRPARPDGRGAAGPVDRLHLDRGSGHRPLHPASAMTCSTPSGRRTAAPPPSRSGRPDRLRAPRRASTSLGAREPGRGQDGTRLRVTAAVDPGWPPASCGSC